MDEFVCLERIMHVGLRLAQNGLLSWKQDEVEFESEVLCARWVGRRCADVTAGVLRQSCCAERPTGMWLLETEHSHNLSTVLKRCNECYNYFLFTVFVKDFSVAKIICSRTVEALKGQRLFCVSRVFQMLRFIYYSTNIRTEYFKHWSVPLTEYCAGGKLEMNEMGRACGAYGGG